ncbi:imidazole glycerol phosphate synthase cyclase subunit [Alphaproteobacteria bacterium]|nr:imidazole glycerol phosphate synthase cyclase subunit [Alphaproteobacteria bacterium]
MDTRNIRVLTKLEVKGPNVIKGIQLEGLRVVGQPNTMAEKYYNQQVDEIIYIDIVASLYNRRQMIETVADSAKKIFIPLTVGGGIRSVEDISMALNSGADKVAVNTAAVNNPEIINEASQKYGSQCVVVSVEAKKRSDGWEVLTENGREKTGLQVFDWIQEAQARGAGEILLTSVDRDGTRKGFDIELYQSLADSVHIPLIACGGCGGLDDVASLLNKTKVDAVCCSNVLHFDRLSVSDIKDTVKSIGFETR